MGSDSNLFWVAFQSNLLADLGYVGEDFQKAFKETKEELEKKGWILPTLEVNMRNQVNIANIEVEKGIGGYDMQSSINKLPSASSVVGEVPSLFNIKSRDDWNKNKEKILRHCIEIIQKKSDKNIVILHDGDFPFKDLEITLKNAIKTKTVLTYPSSSQNKKQNVQNIIDFSQQNNHILITKNKYFNGCEACNLIYLKYGNSGVRNSLMRAVQNVIYIHVGGVRIKIKGMKEDNKFC